MYMRFIVLLSLIVVFQIQGQVGTSSISDSICGTASISDSAATSLPWYGNNEYLLSLSDTINSVLNQQTGVDYLAAELCNDIEDQIVIPIKFWKASLLTSKNHERYLNYMD